MEVTQTYTPKACIGKEAQFSGQVVMRVPSYEERIDLMTETGSIELENQEMPKSQMLKMTKALVEASYPFYVKVDLTYKPTKKVFTSADELRYSAKTAGILTDVATWLLNADILGES